MKKREKKRRLFGSFEKLTVMLALSVCLSLPGVAFAADPHKVIHSVFEAADDGFDMVRTQNYYSGWVADAIFETLLTYDYLARPARLVPNTAESMPEISSNNSLSKAVVLYSGSTRPIRESSEMCIRRA